MAKKPALRSTDLNLFLIFEAIYREGSLTKAGERLGLSQPAVSHAVSRLRNTLNDDLFVRTRGGVTPTIYARSIIDGISAGLDQLRASISGEPQFDPNSSKAVFYVAMSLGFESWIMPPILSNLTQIAPHVTINSARLLRRDLESELAKGEISMAIDVAGPVGPDIKCESLRVDQRVVVSSADHPIVKSGLTAKSYLDADHLMVSSRRRGGALEDYDLARSGKKRRVVARCGSLIAGIQIVEQTDYLLTLGEHQLQSFSPNHNLTVHQYPFKDKMTEIMLFWHQSFDNDPSNAWLRSLIREHAMQTDD